MPWARSSRNSAPASSIPPAEYYDDYYAVFFLDPDGLKLEGMKYGEASKKRAAKRKKPNRRRK